MDSHTTAVVFDVGETLVDETRAWERVARELGVPIFTFMATFGGVIARGEHHSRVFDVLGKRAAAADFEETDLYPDAVPALRRLREAGYLVGVVGNTARSAEQLMQQHADFVASSARWGVEKPSPDFFDRIVRECARSANEIAYVGDRVDNDIAPALTVGLVGIHIRRGPWGHLHNPPAATISINSLDELPGVLP
jgi:HAD superfamily hydrolase (TIGR01549 family)